MTGQRSMFPDQVPEAPVSQADLDAAALAEAMPCPWGCTGRLDINESSTERSVNCLDCGANGPWVPAQSIDAVRAWNAAPRPVDLAPAPMPDAGGG